jgi:ABC-type multidrug transport system fused ATPase/permease subunit
MPAVVKEVEEELPNIQVGRLLKRNKPEWFYILVGVLASCAMGAVNPIYGVLFGDVLGVLGYEDTQLARDDSVKYAFWFLGLASYALSAMLLQGWMFAISGENLTKRLRRDAFQAMLAQEMGWYDSPNNNTGALCARLSGDAAKVQGATGARIGSILQGIAGVFIAIIMGIYYNWKLGLVSSVFFPIMIVATMAEMRIIQGVDTVEKVAFEKSAKVDKICI